MASCSDDEGPDNGGTGSTDTGTGELSEEWYAGGKLGTAFNSTSSAYEQSTPVVDADPEMAASFLRGETFFEDVFIQGSEPGAERTGLGPFVDKKQLHSMSSRLRTRQKGEQI